MLERLEDLPLPLLPGPWIEFQEKCSRRVRWCQPDGLLLDPFTGRAIILEVKYQHTADAWWQLTHLYLPVLAALLPGWKFPLVEICKWYDPATSFPVAPRMLADPLEAREDLLGVHILRA